MVDDFREKLQHVLKVANLSRTRLSKLVGVDKSVASRWVSGATQPTDANLDALTRSLNSELPRLRLSDWSLPIAAFKRRVGPSSTDTDGTIELAAVARLAERLTAKRPTIAVMPFRDLAHSPENEAFCDALTDGLITALARLSGLRVIGRASTFALKRQSIAAQDAAKAMSVRYIVEGQVQRSCERARMTVQLIDADEGVTLWADRFDQYLQDLFQAQDEIVRSLCSRIDTKIILDQASALNTRKTMHWPVADRVRAAFAINYGADPASYAASRELLEPVLAENPDNAFALRALAATDWHEAWLGLASDAKANFRLALQRAQRSIELDPTDEYAYWICGVALMTAGRFDEALAHLRRALEISPSCSLALGAMGTVLAWAGNPDESITYQHLSLACDPHNPSIFFRHNGLGLAHYLRGDLEEARGWLTKALSRRPRWPVPNLLLAAVEARTPNQVAARTALNRALEVDELILNPIKFRSTFPFRCNEHLELLRGDVARIHANTDT
jgi:adenylate cyclase